MWRRKHLPCSEAGEKCEFNVAREMIHDSLDGKVFRVRRLVCAICGRCERVAKQQDSAFVPPAWPQDGAVEANF